MRKFFPPCIEDGVRSAYFLDGFVGAAINCPTKNCAEQLHPEARSGI